MKAQVIELIEWCITYHGGKLLPLHFKEDEASSLGKHKVLRGTHRSMKGIVKGRHSAEYAESIALMDQQFGTAWRPGMGGMWKSRELSRRLRPIKNRWCVQV